MAQKDNFSFYQKAFISHGVSAEGVHWNSKQTQYQRFDVLYHFIKDNLSSCSIADAGCGFAEFYYFLQEKQHLPKRYIGIDCEEHMISSSQNRFPTVEFYLQDILGDKLFEADYYICSGALNVLNKYEIFLFISTCFNYCKKGFAFNFMQIYHFNTITKSDLEEFCHSLTPYVTIEEDYIQRDFSFFLEKEKAE